MELWNLGATELAQRIARRDVSCTEAVSSCLERLEAINPVLNAVVDLDRHQALRDAAAADAALARGDACGPLHGVPVTIKVNVDQQGHATTHGVPAFRDNLAMQDSAVVANLRLAGAIPMGRTNTPAFSMRWFTDNLLHGRTCNPLNRQLTPGGSSGGAAVAVAAGFGPIAHGNDQGGSIRYPAYACGVYGLRPSVGRIPAFNPGARTERPPTVHATSVQGPLARNVPDLRLALAAMSARDVRDPAWVPAPPSGTGRPHRVALCLGAPGYRVDPEVQGALRLAAKHLAQAGYEVEEMPPPRLRETADLWLALTLADTRALLEAHILAGGDPAIIRAYRDMLHHAPRLDLPSYIQAQADRIALQREWAVFLDQYPLLLLPTSWKRPFPIDMDQHDNTVMRTLLDAQSTLLATAILGLPGLAVPMEGVEGVARGVPCGVQLVAARFNEHLCLDAAEVMAAQRSPVLPIDPVMN